MLERNRVEQPAWDAFMASDGGSSAQAALIKAGGDWSNPMQDGRSSRALLALAERLRAYKAQGRRLSVRLMIPNEGAASNDDYEGHMASSVADTAKADPDALVIAYSGNRHATKGRNIFDGDAYTYAAGRLPPSSLISIFLAGHAGNAWNCQSEGCGAHPYNHPMQAPRGVYVNGAPEGFDAIAFTGTATTASPPAGVQTSAATSR